MYYYHHMMIYKNCVKLSRLLCFQRSPQLYAYAELGYLSTIRYSTICSSRKARSARPQVVGDREEPLHTGRTLSFSSDHNIDSNLQDSAGRDIPIKTTRIKPFHLESSEDSRSRDHAEFEDVEHSNAPAYETHIPTNIMQRTILSIGAAATALLDPRRHDMVAVLGETTGYRALSRIYTLMIQDTEGQQVLMEKPRINSTSVDLSYLSKLPEDTLGYFYIKFLKDNQVTPDSRLPVQFVDDPELAYVMQRYREGHDLFHTILGMPTNMLGEVAVKWVEAIQTGLPMCYGAAVFGPLRFRPKQRQKYLSIYLPWAIQVGRSSKLLMNMYFEKRWEQPLDELRKEFGIEPPEI